MNKFDVFDLIAAVGLVLLGTAVYLSLGLTATLAFAGVVLVAFAATGSSMAARVRRE